MCSVDPLEDDEAPLGPVPVRVVVFWCVACAIILMWAWLRGGA